jgi:glycosyltransferase involved in cell wall biosynthesis
MLAPSESLEDARLGTDVGVPNAIGLAICIPTFKRATLLKALLYDLSAQGLRPNLLVIVDGDPKSGEVLAVLEPYSLRAAKGSGQVLYIPSNHSNLPYQRFLGWRVAKDAGAELLVYLDDDLRIADQEAISRLVAPLRSYRDDVSACTGSVVYPKDRGSRERLVPGDRVRGGVSGVPWLVRMLGSSRGIAPGGLSPSGHRLPPCPSVSGNTDIQWLRGGVMAIRMAFFSNDCFSEDLFALAELGYGHGEDTLLSRRLGPKGRLLFVPSAEFLHPCSDLPRAYTTRAAKMGFGTAYSRRLLNDNYRWPKASESADRIALWKSYIGTALLHWLRAIRQPKSHRFAFAWGYSKGAWMGVTRPPKASRLTPGVDWRKDAHRALAAAETIPL